MTSTPSRSSVGNVTVALAISALLLARSAVTLRFSLGFGRVCHLSSLVSGGGPASPGSFTVAFATSSLLSAAGLGSCRRFRGKQLRLDQRGREASPRDVQQRRRRRQPPDERPIAAVERESRLIRHPPGEVDHRE